MAQWVKDLVLSLQQLGMLLWHGFHPWPGTFHMPWVQPKKKLLVSHSHSEFNAVKKRCYLDFCPTLTIIQVIKV